MSSSIYAYYKLPRISRTPSPPIEYLRRRQEMGGASLPPLPEDENYTADQPHSRLNSPDCEAVRPKKKRKSGSLRIKHKVKGGPIDWSRVFSDGEDGSEILDSIVVKGGVLSTALNAAWSADTKKTKVVSQKIKSRKQIIEAPICRVLDQHDYHAHMPVLVVTPGHTAESPRPSQQSVSKSNLTLANKMTVKYVKPYPSSPPHILGPAVASKAKTSLPELQDFIPLTQRTLDQSVVSPAHRQLQPQQSDSLKENDSHHNRTSPCDICVCSATPSSPITSELSNSVRRSARQPVLSSKIREAQRSSSPCHLTLLVSRTDVNPSSTVHPFKIAGDEFIKGGRWMWLQLISIIKDRTNFDPSQDEILLNWITPLPDIDMLRDQQKEMKRMGNNEIVVVRTTKEGYWPEWMYERIKERKRQVRREWERERLEKEQAERETRRSRTFSNGVIPLPSKVDEILPGVAFKDVPAPTLVDGTDGQNDNTTLAVREAPTSLVLDKPIEDPALVPVGGKIFTPKLRGTREIATSPPLEDEAVAPEIPEVQEGSDTIPSAEKFTRNSRVEDLRMVRFTSLNQVLDLEQSMDPNPTLVEPSAAEKLRTLPSSIVTHPTPPVIVPLPQPTVPAVPTPQSASIVSVSRLQPGRVTAEASAEAYVPITLAAPTPSVSVSLTASIIKSLASAPLASAVLAPSLVPPTSAPVPPPVPTPPTLVQTLALASVSPAVPSSGPSKTPQTGSVAVAKYPPRPPPTFLGRLIPMPQAYKRPVNMPPRPSHGFSPQLTGMPHPYAHSKTGSAIIAAPIAVNTTVAPSSTASVPIPRMTPSQDTNVFIKNPSLPTPEVTTGFPCNVTNNNTGVELTLAAEVAASGPLAKWLSRQGGPTVKPRAVTNYAVPTPVPPGKKRGRPITRKSMPTAVGEPVTQVSSETRPIQGIAPPTRTTISPPLPSSLLQSNTMLPTLTLPSYPPCITSSTLSTAPSHIDNKGPTIAPFPTPSLTPHAPCTLPASCTLAPCITPASSLLPHAPSTSPAININAPLGFSTPPAPSALPSPSAPPTLVNLSPPPTAKVEISTSVPPPSLSTIENPLQHTDNTAMTITDSIACITATQTPPPPYQNNHDSDPDLDLNLDLHFIPFPRKETRVPSWVKSKTPVSKSRLSGVGVLGPFGSRTSPITKVPQSTISAMRSVSCIDKPTWDGEVLRNDTRDEPILLSMQIKDGGGPMGNGDGLETGLDLQCGIKRPRANTCLHGAKHNQNGSHLVGLTGTPPGQNTVGGLDLMKEEMTSASKRVRREGSGEYEDFLSWSDGGVRTLGRGEEDVGKDLDLGF